MLPDCFDDFTLQVLNGWKERLNAATLDRLVHNTILGEIKTDAYAKDVSTNY